MDSIFKHFMRVVLFIQQRRQEVKKPLGLSLKRITRGACFLCLRQAFS